MLLITVSKFRRLLCLNYVQRVVPADLENAREEMKSVLAELPDGFRLLGDFSQVESVDPDCSVEMGRTMDIFDQRGVNLILRVIPDSSKDIGLNILTVFHYRHPPRVISCRNLAEALHQLSLWP